MPVLLVLIFVGVPLLELFVVLQVGSAIGGWLTAALLIVDSIIGAVLLRVEGRRAWSEFRRALTEGRWPGDEVAEGALIIVGGTLLVTPGFVTDAAGFVLLLGPTRRVVARRVRARMEASVLGGAAASRRADDPARPRSPRGAVPGRRRGAGAGNRVDHDPAVEVLEIRREQPPAGEDPSRPGGTG